MAPPAQAMTPPMTLLADTKTATTSLFLSIKVVGIYTEGGPHNVGLYDNGESEDNERLNNKQRAEDDGALNDDKYGYADHFNGKIKLIIYSKEVGVFQGTSFLRALPTLARVTAHKVMCLSSSPNLLYIIVINGHVIVNYNLNYSLQYRS